MEPPGGSGRHRGTLQDCLLLYLSVCVAASQDLQRGADGGMPLHLTVDGLDLVEDVRGELDVQMVGHHAQYEPVTKLEAGGQLVHHGGGEAGGPAHLGDIDINNVGSTVTSSGCSDLSTEGGDRCYHLNVS